MFNLLYKSFGTIFVYICVRGKTYEHPKNVWHLNLSVFITNLLEMQKKNSSMKKLGVYYFSSVCESWLGAPQSWSKYSDLSIT